MAYRREAFFAELPADEFTPWEAAIREALLGVFRHRPGVFPLMEWIERRLGGELRISRSKNGLGEIALQSGPAPSVTPDPDAFFATLPADSFGPKEEALRDAIFDFLASWRSEELAHLGDLLDDSNIQARQKSLLPPGVPLREWLERRIGGEVELREDSPPDPPTIALTAVSRPIVAARYTQKMLTEEEKPPGSWDPPPEEDAGARAAGGSRPQPPAPPAPPSKSAPPGRSRGPAPPAVAPPSTPPWAAAPPPGQDRGGWRAPPGGPPVADRASRAEAFFATLPPDELTEQELELRQVVIAYLERHSAGPGEPVRISDVTVDPVISAARARLLPQEVPLRAWLDQRIGGEVEISSDPKTGIWQAGLRSDAGAEEPTGGGGPGSSAVARDDFFAGLPEDSFTEDEEALRLALLDLLEGWRGGGPPTLRDAMADAAVRRARARVLPRGSGPVSLKDWIERRMGGEIETAAGAGGQTLFGLVGALGSEGGGSAGTKRKGDAPAEPSGKRGRRAAWVRH